MNSPKENVALARDEKTAKTPAAICLNFVYSDLWLNSSDICHSKVSDGKNGGMAGRRLDTLPSCTYPKLPVQNVYRYPHKTLDYFFSRPILKS
jgi:hypothetical protein